MKLIVFGERPGPNTDPKRPLFPHTTTGAAAKLIQLLGWTEERYLLETVRYNALHDGFSELPLDTARERVETLLNSSRHLHNDPRFLFCGRAAMRCAPKKYRDQRMGEIHDDVMAIPHPSGVNRYYNDTWQTQYIKDQLRIFTAG